MTGGQESLMNEGMKGGGENKKERRKIAKKPKKKGEETSARFGRNIVEMKTTAGKRARQIKKRKAEGQKMCERKKKAEGGVTFPASTERVRGEFVLPRNGAECNISWESRQKGWRDGGMVVAEES